MFKNRFKLILIGLVLLPILWVFIKFQEPSQKIPYPYLFKKSSLPEISKASKSDILIVGDRMGLHLSKYTDALGEKLSQGLRRPLKIYNWSHPNEGLHRTIRKLRKIPTLPPVLIYHGATQEFFEQKFHLRRDYKTIINNFRKYKDDPWASLLQLFPWLGRFVYTAPKYVWPPKEPIKYSPEYSATATQRYMEITYKLFEIEFQELLDFLQDKETTLIIIPPPLDLSSAPKKVCTNSVTPSIIKQQKTLQQKISTNQDTKGTLIAAQRLLNNSPGNALSYYLRGLAYKNLGRFRDARASLYRAGLYDCDTSKGNIIFNKILITFSEQNEVPVIDFNHLVNQDFGQKDLFAKNSYPHPFYYQKLMDNLEEKIKTILEL